MITPRICRIRRRCSDEALRVVRSGCSRYSDHRRAGIRRGHRHRHAPRHGERADHLAEGRGRLLSGGRIRLVRFIQDRVRGLRRVVLLRERDGEPQGGFPGVHLETVSVGRGGLEIIRIVFREGHRRLRRRVLSRSFDRTRRVSRRTHRMDHVPRGFRFHREIRLVRHRFPCHSDRVVPHLLHRIRGFIHHRRRAVPLSYDRWGVRGVRNQCDAVGLLHRPPYRRGGLELCFQDRAGVRGHLAPRRGGYARRHRHQLGRLSVRQVHRGCLGHLGP